MTQHRKPVERFEELIAWQRARELAALIYDATSRSPFAVDYGLRNQIQRAAVSTMSNIAEGFERYSRKEFAQYLSIARGSVAEVRSQLYVALDVGHIDQATFDRLHGRCLELGKIIGGLRNSLGSTKY
jgi:four helix bundle protein